MKFEIEQHSHVSSFVISCVKKMNGLELKNVLKKLTIYFKDT